MEDKLAKYLHQNCSRVRKIKVIDGILVVGDNILYTGAYTESEKIKYIDDKTKDKFDKFDELLEHVKEQT